VHHQLSVIPWVLKCINTAEVKQDSSIQGKLSILDEYLQCRNNLLRLKDWLSRAIREWWILYGISGQGYMYKASVYNDMHKHHARSRAPTLD